MFIVHVFIESSISVVKFRISIGDAHILTNTKINCNRNLYVVWYVKKKWIRANI